MKNQRAFTLLELAIAMTVVAILAVKITPSIIQDVNLKAAYKTAQELQMVIEAAYAYREHFHQWPLSIEELKKEGFLLTGWSAINPWQFPYTINMENHLLVVLTRVPKQWIQVSAGLLPHSIIEQEELLKVSRVKRSGDSLVPKGVIVAWSGTIAQIPKDWHLCDGTNGTPDLRDKFIMGASEDMILEGQERAGVTVQGVMMYQGGSMDHDHGGFTAAHQLTIDEMPRHRHGYMAAPLRTSRYSGHESPVITSNELGFTDWEGGNQAHRHGITRDQHLPPFYVLAYIMKL